MILVRTTQPKMFSARRAHGDMLTFSPTRPEFAHTNTSFGLPTVSCFIPSLQQGEPFQISIHSWNGHPPISEFTKSYSKYSDSVKFEVRVFINGQFTAYVFSYRSHNIVQILNHHQVHMLRPENFLASGNCAQLWYGNARASFFKLGPRVEIGGFN